MKDSSYVDHEGLQEVYNYFEKNEKETGSNKSHSTNYNEILLNLLESAITTLKINIPNSLLELRPLLMLLVCPKFIDPSFHRIFSGLCSIIVKMAQKPLLRQFFIKYLAEFEFFLFYFFLI